MKKTISHYVLRGAVRLSLMFAALPVLAQVTPRDKSPISQELSDSQRLHRSIFGGNAGFRNINLPDLVAIVIRTFISLLAIMFLGLIIYGGYIWMMARGNENEVTRAKGIIRQSIVGLIVVMSSYAIGYFVLYYIIYGGTGPGAPVGV